MRSIYLMAVAAMGCLHFSCQKDLEMPVEEDTIPHSRVKTYSEEIFEEGGAGSETVLLALTYDAKNRVNMVADSDKKFIIRATYPNPGLRSWDVLVDGVREVRVEEYLNGRGLPDSTCQFALEEPVYSTKQSYNAKGLITQIKEYEHEENRAFLNDVIQYFYDNEDKVARTENTLNRVVHYTYYDSLMNRMPESEPFFSLKPKGKLIKKLSMHQGNQLIEEINYTYTFDNKNRIASIQHKYLHSNLITVKRYTYY